METKKKWCNLVNQWTHLVDDITKEVSLGCCDQPQCNPKDCKHCQEQAKPIAKE